MNLPTPKYVVSDPKENHRYRIELPNGTVVEKLVSVTGVLDVISKPALYQWYAKSACELIRQKLNTLANVPIVITPEWIDEVVAEGRKRQDKIKDEAAEIGTAAHAAFERIIRGEPLGAVPPSVAEPAAEFARWFAKTNIRIVASELPVGSITHRFGGRIDALGVVGDDEWVLLDWKTSNGLYPEMALQVGGGYALALAEQYGVSVGRAYIARFSKKEPWGSECCELLDIAAAQRGFISALELKHTLAEALIGEPVYSTFAARAEQSEKTATKARKAAKARVGTLGF